MKKIYLLGIVVVGWSVVGWAMDEKDDSYSKSGVDYGSFSNPTNRLKHIRTTGIVDGLIYHKNGEIITSLAHHPVEPRYAEGTTDKNGSMYFRQRGIRTVDGVIAEKDVASSVLVKYSPNGRSFAASAGHDLVLYQDNVKSKTSLFQTINSIEFSGTSDWLIISTSSKAGNGHKLSFYNTHDIQPLSHESYLHELNERISFLTAATRDSEKLACGGDKKVYYCTFDSNKLVESFEQQNSISFDGTLYALKFTKEGRHLLLLRDNVVEQVNPVDGTIVKSVAINNDAPQCLVPFYVDNGWLVGTEEGKLVKIDPDQQQAFEYSTGLSAVTLLSASREGAIVVSDGRHVKSFCLDYKQIDSQKKEHTIANDTLELHSVRQEKALKRRKCIRNWCIGSILGICGSFTVYYAIIKPISQIAS